MYTCMLLFECLTRLTKKLFSRVYVIHKALTCRLVARRSIFQEPKSPLLDRGLCWAQLLVPRTRVYRRTSMFSFPAAVTFWRNQSPPATVKLSSVKFANIRYFDLGFGTIDRLYRVRRSCGRFQYLKYELICNCDGLRRKNTPLGNAFQVSAHSGHWKYTTLPLGLCVSIDEKLLVDKCTEFLK